jgi:hypothetical protein
LCRQILHIKTFTYRNKDGSYWLDSPAPSFGSNAPPMDAHIQELVDAGWEPMNSASDPGHVRLGKTLILTALTGGLNLFFGASRTAQTITLTFRQSRVPVMPRIVEGTKQIPSNMGGAGSCAFCGASLPSRCVFCCSACAEAQKSRAVGTVERAAKQLNASLTSQSTEGALGWYAGRLFRGANRHPAVMALFCLAGLFVWLFVAGRTPGIATVPPPGEQIKVAAIIDLPKLALKTRAEVERELGKPSRYIQKTINELADEADYPWGIAGYNQSRLNFLILRFQTTPRDYQEAFGLLNLPHPTPPFVAVGGDGTRQLFWRARTYGTEYTCCENLAIQDIWISIDWKEMHLLILDLDDPETWLDQQCTMYVQRAGLALPKGATWRGDPLRRPIVPRKKARL